MSYDPALVRCVECGKEIVNPDMDAWQELTGWERRREQGGTNHVALRRPTGNFMCLKCMSYRQAGLDPGQLAAF